MKSLDYSKIQYHLDVYYISREDDAGEIAYNGIIFPGRYGKSGTMSDKEKMKMAVSVFKSINQYSSQELDNINVLGLVNDGFTIEIIKSDVRYILDRFESGKIIDDGSLTDVILASNKDGWSSALVPTIIHHPEIDAVTSGNGIITPFLSDSVTSFLQMGLLRENRIIPTLRLVILTGEEPLERFHIPYISGGIRGGELPKIKPLLDMAKADYECKRKVKNYQVGHIYYYKNPNTGINRSRNYGYEKYLYLGTLKDILLYTRDSGDEHDIYYFNPYNARSYSYISRESEVCLFLRIKTEPFESCCPTIDKLLYLCLVYNRPFPYFRDIMFVLGSSRIGLIDSGLLIDVPSDTCDKIQQTAYQRVKLSNHNSLPHLGGSIGDMTSLENEGFQYVSLGLRYMTIDQKEVAKKILQSYLSPEILEAFKENVLSPIHLEDEVSRLIRLLD